MRAGADVATRMQFINAEGFGCSAQEIEAVGAELTDADLDKVAGGFVDDLWEMMFAVFAMSVHEANADKAYFVNQVSNANGWRQKTS